ncbi:MAG TPA: hypothetical protein VFK78_07045 [Gemmatimonadales bacterium]|nr:hypothetical protein [Gemmatimonadales bacterium]
MTKPLAVLSVIALGAAGSLAGQAGTWTVAPAVSLIRYDRTSALSSTASGLSTKLWPQASLDATYGVRSNLRVGIYLGASRVTTSPDYFPLVLFRTGSNYELWSVQQRVSVFNYGAQVQFDLPVAPAFSPYLRGGVGRHTLYPDVQKQNAVSTVSGSEFMLGAGLRYSKGSAALRLEVTDFMWSNFDRDALNPVTADFQNTVFPQDNPKGVRWAKPSLTHNLRLALGFAFSPSSGGNQ